MTKATKAKTKENGDNNFSPPSITGLLDGKATGEKDEMIAALEEGLGSELPNESFGVPIIRINHKEEAFIVPGGELIPTIEGYPIHHFQMRKWWEKGYKEGDSSPPRLFFA